jgi:uncharacterized membrane protein YesL
MNIKLKAFLITFAVLFGLFGSVYTLFFYPELILLVGLAAAFYGLYNIVLDSLQGKEVRGPR